MRVACFLFSAPLDLSAFAESCLRFTPQICLGPQSLFLEIGRCQKLYSESSFLLRAGNLLKRFNLEARIAIGPSVPHALCEAKYGEKETARLPLAALRDFADPFAKADDLAIPRMIESLQHLGLTSVEEFLKLPSASLSSRFGPQALLCRYRILEELECPWPQWVPEPKIIEEKEFQYEEFCADVQGLLALIDSSLDRLFLRLWARSLSINALKIVLKFERLSTSRHNQRELLFEFMLPQKTKRSVLPMIRERFEREFARRPIESPIEKLTLEVLQFSRDHSGQRNFFSNHEEIEEQFNSAVATLIEGAGKESVFRAKIVATPIPEQSWQRSLAEQKELPDVAKHLAPRPTRLLRRPERVFVTQNTLHIRQKPYRILEWSDVEQIAAGWLDQKVLRNYYRLEIDKKPPVWIFKDAKDDYYLHGYFD